MSRATIPTTISRTILVIDLVGYFRLVETRGDEATFELLGEFYHLVQETTEASGGRVVKTIGDAVLVVFPPEITVRAVACALSLREAVTRLGERLNLNLRCGINLHRATVIEAVMWPAGPLDVVGAGVNFAFTMGRGAGLRISEPVYRALKSGDRSPWIKNRPPTVYAYQDRPGS